MKRVTFENIPCIMKNCNRNEGTIATQLTNPGIIDRLDQDIQDYLHEFGFSIQREYECDNDDMPRKDKAVIFIPALPYYFHPRNEDGCNAKTSYESIATTTSDGPIGTLHLHIQNELLVPTIGPLLRTLLRLAVHIPPQRLRAILYCDFVFDPLHKFSKMSLLQRRQHMEQQEDIAARKMANAVHMLVRNSMGSALCLDLAILLPCYWRRRSNEKEPVPLSKVSVEQAMENGYQSIQLVERNNHDFFTSHHTNSSSIQLHASTRMCTVRHQPLLFRWINQICCDQSARDAETVAPTALFSSSPSLVHDRQMPLIVACVEKPGNLHRILMLCHDYLSLSATVLCNLIVVMSIDGERHGVKQLFQGAIHHFCETVLREGGAHGKDCLEDFLPTLMYEDEAAMLIQTRLNQHGESRDKKRLSSPQTPSLIGIDLHPNALTLSGSYYMSETLSPAQEALLHADAIVFGYESIGIPPNVGAILNSWVKIPSRSSINIVAAMSIIFDSIFHTLQTHEVCERENTQYAVIY